MGALGFDCMDAAVVGLVVATVVVGAALFRAAGDGKGGGR